MSTPTVDKILVALIAMVVNIVATISIDGKHSVFQIFGSSDS